MRTRLGFVLLLAACSAEIAPFGEEPAPPLGATAIERASCPDDAGAAFQRIATGAEGPVFGPCGAVAWRDAASGALYAAAPGEAPVHVDDDAIPISFDEALLYLRPDEVALAVDGETVRRWTVPGVARIGHIPGSDALWACSPTRGIERLDEHGVTALTPDFLAGGEIDGCRGVDPSRTGPIAYPTHDFRVGIVEPLGGTRSTTDLAFYPWGSRDEWGNPRADGIRITPDASAILRERRRLELHDVFPIGEVAEGTIVVLPLDATQPTEVGGFLAPLQHDAGRTARAGRDGIFVPGFGRAGNLVVHGAVLPYDAILVRAQRGEHLFVDGGAGAALLHLGDGSLRPLFGAGVIMEALPFRWGGPVAFSVIERHCVEGRGRGLCHTLGPVDSSCSRFRTALQTARPGWGPIWSLTRVQCGSILAGCTSAAHSRTSSGNAWHRSSNDFGDVAPAPPTIGALSKRSSGCYAPAPRGGTFPPRLASGARSTSASGGGPSPVAGMRCCGSSQAAATKASYC